MESTKEQAKKSRREEETASGIEVDDQDEKDILLDELTDQEEAIRANTGSKDDMEKAATKDVGLRNKALERLQETTKRKKIMVMVQPRKPRQEEVQKVL